MCDYSLMNIPNRLAREGEELVTHRFETGCMGLTSPSELARDADSAAPGPRTFWSTVRQFFDPPEAKPVRAVCIPPGASLRLMDIPERLQREFSINSAEEVRFTQLTSAANTYRDAVRFSNGREIPLQGLREGQRVFVRTLGQAEVSDSLMPEELVRRTS